MSMSIVQVRVPVTTTGSAGTATGSGYSEALNGLLIDIYLDFEATAPGTTDATITSERGDTIWARSDSAADVLIAPRETCVNNANAAITNSFSEYPLCGRVTVALAQCNAITNAVVAYIRYWAFA